MLRVGRYINQVLERNNAIRRKTNGYLGCLTLYQFLTRIHVAGIVVFCYTGIRNYLAHFVDFIIRSRDCCTISVQNLSFES